MCSDLLDRHLSHERITARIVMSCAGFLNFITSVIRQGRPFLRSLYQDLAKCQVFAAWQSGKRRFDLDITLSSAAVQDLTWWCLALRTPLYRPLQVAGGKIFIWHQRHPDFSHLFQLAWPEGLVVVIHTHASGDGGWGVACGNIWKQGEWTPEELQHSINWKELEAYRRALDLLEHLVSGKLVLIKVDSTCALHYINHGTGRVQVLSDLAKCIRLREAQLGVESVAVHVEGERNVTADGLSRMTVSAQVRDTRPARSLRKRLFHHIESLIGKFKVDAMAADDGHNAMRREFHCPGRSFFARARFSELTWVFLQGT